MDIFHSEFADTEEDYELPRELMPPISKVSRNKEIE